jgi:PAS domain S-box-containing protein
MSIMGSSPEERFLDPQAWLYSEALSDLLAEGDAGLEDICRRAIDFILENLQLESGALLIQRAGEEQPFLLVGKAVPPGWQYALEHTAHSPLESVFHALRWAEEFSLQRIVLPGVDRHAWVAPLGNQGLLALFGEEITPAAENRLIYLTRPIVRTVKISRSHARASRLTSDQTELRIAQADLEVSRTELMRSRNTLRSLFDSLPPALYIVDGEFKLVAVNRSRAQRAGKLPQELVGRACYSALYGRSTPCPGCRVVETLANGTITERTERQWGQDEEAFEREISTFPIDDDQGRVLQAVIFEQDVTENRRLERTLAHSEKLAAVGEMAASLAHEISNPLTAILANAQLLQRDLPAGSDLRESVDLIAHAGARAAQVVRNLLDFARQDQAAMKRIDLNENVQQAIALTQHERAVRSVSLSWQPAPDLPLLLAAPEHLTGVWLNLLINAIDSVDWGGMILVHTLQLRHELCVKIKDNGRGIPPEKLVHIFEPFYTTKAPGRGTGLGLPVCQRIIQQHGGRIEVDSQPGAGSEFRVFLPIR